MIIRRYNFKLYRSGDDQPNGNGKVIKTQIELITPEWAGMVLRDLNKTNRVLRKKTVDYLADQMDAGRWICTHQGIAFFEDGTLADGQHRLAAVVKHKKPITMMVSRGLPLVSFQALDIGIKRSFSDTTGLSGDKAAMCRALQTFAPGRANRRISPAEVLEISQSGIGDVFDALVSRNNTARKFVSSASARAAACCLVYLGVADQDEVINLYDCSVRLPDDAPNIIMSLYRRIISGRMPHTTKIESFAMALKYLNPENASAKTFRISQCEIDSAAIVAERALKLVKVA